MLIKFPNRENEPYVPALRGLNTEMRQRVGSLQRMIIGASLPRGSPLLIRLSALCVLLPVPVPVPSLTNWASQYDPPLHLHPTAVTAQLFWLDGHLTCLNTHSPPSLTLSSSFAFIFLPSFRLPSYPPSLSSSFTTRHVYSCSLEHYSHRWSWPHRTEAARLLAYHCERPQSTTHRRKSQTK
jgi:hypothetical protein